MSVKLIFAANTSWYLYNFRRSLMRRMQEAGFEVVAVSPADEYSSQLRELGFRWVEWSLERSGMNPFGEWNAVERLTRIYRDERPELVHHFTIKCVLYGTLAARRARVRRIVNSVTGLGHVFISRRPAARVVRPLIRRWYRRVLTGPDVRTIFQNDDDLHIISLSLPELKTEAVLVRGSGVDLERFQYQPHQDHARRPQILFAGRLLAEKGVHEFVEAARLCVNSGLDAEFVICGNPDPGNPSSVDDQTLESWKTEDFLSLPGHVDPIDEFLARSDIVVLPSYREGTPRLLLEAAALGKPLIAADVPGCREVVIDGENGILVPCRDAQSLANAIIHLAHNPEERSRMGRCGRRLMEQSFDERIVIEKTLNVYRDLAVRAGAQSMATGPGVDRGVFVFSLDLELAWGTRGRPLAGAVPPYLDGTREAILQLLGLFEQYDIAATWATVGALLLGQGKSGGRHEWLQDSAFDDVPAGDAASEPHWYGEDIIDRLLECRTEQEIGCHTLTHVYVDPAVGGRPILKREIELFDELFKERGLPNVRTFIYPKAKMGHIDLIAAHGYSAYRGPENKWFESLPGERVRAAVRVVDGRLGVAPCVKRPEFVDEQLWMIPSSQFYSPFMSVGKYVSLDARIKKAVKGLNRAADNGGVYHLWTHPFNLGFRTDELMRGMHAILAEAARLRDAGRIEILTMGDMADRLNTQRTKFARLLQPDSHPTCASPTSLASDDQHTAPCESCRS